MQMVVVRLPLVPPLAVLHVDASHAASGNGASRLAIAPALENKNLRY